MIKNINKNLIFMLIGDIAFIIFSLFFSYLIRFDFNIPKSYLDTFFDLVPLILPIKILVFYYFDIYKGMWRYTSITDLFNIIKGVVISSLIIVCFVLYKTRFVGFSRSIFIIDAVLSLVFIGGFRMLIRMFLTNNFTVFQRSIRNGKILKKIIVIGAGDAGEKVIREVHDNPQMGYVVAGFVDDDRKKTGKHIHGVKVFGTIDDLQKVVQHTHVDELLIAMPSASGKEIRRIIEICNMTKMPYKTLPGIGELIDGKVSIKTVRDISYKDLLGRKSVMLENQKISSFIKNKTILITGAGGSIGSELCRQVCKFSPALMILFDASESNLYAIQMELKHTISYVRYRTVLGRVQNPNLLDQVFKKYRPDVVFHAAAYKHVPLIERNPWEAVFNNIVGTQEIVKASVLYEVDRFVLVSTDKAVKPTNVMGASKRVTEKIIQANGKGKTKFMAVRFGNVIGSSGSVIPLFCKQIEMGGPVTITHPEITRYFMTIDEAAQLILQAFTMGKGGEIFILEMGTPVKILDMARDLIKLAGKQIESEIKIEFTGLRPGEKLYEELITQGEGIVETDHKNILVLENGVENFITNEWLEEKIGELTDFANQYNSDKIKKKINEIVKNYTMSDDECVV